MDVPEVKYSVCIYKQASLTLTTMTLFLTRHIGIESLCTAQAIIHETDKICLPTPKDAQGNSTASCDFYGCWLLDLLIEKDGICKSLAHLQAYSICQKKHLHTHSDHGNSVESGIHSHSATGTTFPFPTGLHTRKQPSTPMVVKENDVESPSSQEQDSFFLRIIQCKLEYKSLCFRRAIYRTQAMVSSWNRT
jgi:hypothetical protein